MVLLTMQNHDLKSCSKWNEYDKDIALAIRYAVDNGAKVINGSFGKYYSQHKEWVMDAIKYAESKDVLVVIAGNESYDLDVTNKYQMTHTMEVQNMLKTF